jgi:type 1 glutamine amidotransferase
LATLAVAATLLGLSCSGQTDDGNGPDGENTGAFSVLVFSKTAGFRHASIPAAIAALETLGADNDFAVETTEDASIFTDAELGRFDAVVFLMTTGDVLDAGQQGAFERFIQQGGGFVGVHSATDTEYSWPWYGGLVGAYFESHPAVQEAIIRILDHTHPAVATLPDEWVRTDEWYNFQAVPTGVEVLALLDEGSYQGGKHGSPHPIAWYHNYDGGRSFYTAGGHTIDSYSERLFLDHLLGGIVYAATGRLTTQN